MPDLIERLFHLRLPPHASVKVAESSLDQLLPVELRADLALELLDEEREPVLLIVLEKQRDEDEDKKYSWPVHVTGVRARRRCEAMLLVVAPDEKVAAWCAEPIDVGLGLTTTTVPDAARERILAEKDLGRLDHWIERAVVAGSVADAIDDPR